MFRITDCGRLPARKITFSWPPMTGYKLNWTVQPAALNTFGTS